MIFQPPNVGPFTDSEAPMRRAEWEAGLLAFVAITAHLEICF